MPNNAFERTVGHRGRPLNSVVRRHEITQPGGSYA